MSKVKAFLTVLFSAIGIFGAREFYKPKNIKELLHGRGIKLSSEGRVGESMFFENKKELEDMKIESPTALGGGCNEKFKITNLSDEIFNEAKKFCSDNPTTIMARVIREGEENRLIDHNNKEGFKVNYLLANDRKGVHELIKLPEPTTLEAVGERLSEWCKEQQTVKVLKAEEKSKIVDFKTRCYSLDAKNYKDLLEKQGRRPLKTAEEFRRKFKDEKFEHIQELKQEIKTIFDRDGGSEKLKLLIRTSAKSDDGESTAIYRKGLNIDSDKKDEEEAFLLSTHGWRIYQLGCQEKSKTSLVGGGERGTENADNYGKFRFRCSTEN